MKTFFTIMLLMNISYAPCVQNKPTGHSCSNNAPFCSAPNGDCAQSSGARFCRQYDGPEFKCDECPERIVAGHSCNIAEFAHGCWGEQGNCGRGLQCMFQLDSPELSTMTNDPNSGSTWWTPCRPHHVEQGCKCRDPTLAHARTAHKEYDDLMAASYGLRSDRDLAAAKQEYDNKIANWYYDLEVEAARQEKEERLLAVEEREIKRLKQKMTRPSRLKQKMTRASRLKHKH
eukprot:129607_1